MLGFQFSRAEFAIHPQHGEVIEQQHSEDNQRLQGVENRVEQVFFPAAQRGVDEVENQPARRTHDSDDGSEQHEIYIRFANHGTTRMVAQTVFFEGVTLHGTPGQQPEGKSSREEGKRARQRVGESARVEVTLRGEQINHQRE